MESTLPPTFWELVDRAAKENPDAPVVSDDHGRSFSRIQLRDAAEAAAAALSGRGVTTDTVVSWQLPTTIEAVVLLVALARIGAVQNPLIPILREREVSFITQQVGTELLIVPKEWRGFAHGAMAQALAPSGGFDVMEIDLDEIGVPGSQHGLSLPTRDPNSSVRSPAPSIDGPRWIYYSSGTTADPKGARHTDASIMSSSNALLELMGFRENDVYPIPWPITHIGGASVLASSIRGGVHLVLFETFDPVKTPRRMALYEPTALGTAVPFFRAYLDAAHSNNDAALFPALRFGTFGGAPVPTEIHHEMRATFGVPLIGSWGLTEFPNATSAAPMIRRRSSQHRLDGRRRVSPCAPLTPRGTSARRGRKVSYSFEVPNASPATWIRRSMTLRSMSMDGSTLATLARSILPETSGSRGDSRTSLSATQRTFPSSRSRKCSTVTRLSQMRPYSDYLTTNGRAGRSCCGAPGGMPCGAERYP